MKHLLVTSPVSSYTGHEPNILRREHNFSMKQKNSLPVPQMVYFEKLSFCSGGNFSEKGCMLLCHIGMSG